MQWSVVYHPEQIVKGRLVQPPRCIPEDSLPVALGQGWILLGRDSEFVSETTDVNVQMNPRRVIQPGEDTV
jgi:hypothetical protein